MAQLMNFDKPLPRQHARSFKERLGDGKETSSAFHSRRAQASLGLVSYARCFLFSRGSSLVVPCFPGRRFWAGILYSRLFGRMRKLLQAMAAGDADGGGPLSRVSLLGGSRETEATTIERVPYVVPVPRETRSAVRRYRAHVDGRGYGNANTKNPRGRR